MFAAFLNPTAPPDIDLSASAQKRLETESVLDKWSSLKQPFKTAQEKLRHRELATAHFKLFLGQVWISSRELLIKNASKQEWYWTSSAP